VEYRRSLTASFLFKFFALTSLALERQVPGSFKPDLSPSERSAGVVFHRPVAQGVQFHAEAEPHAVSGAQLCIEQTTSQVLCLSTGFPCEA
jgi:hypothetical protein